METSSYNGITYMVTIYQWMKTSDLVYMPPSEQQPTQNTLKFPVVNLYIIS